MLLRASEDITIQPSTSLTITTNVVVVRRKYFAPLCVVSVVPLSSHWLASYTRQAFDLKCGFLNPKIEGRLHLIVYNPREFNAIQVQKNSPLGELLVHGFMYEA